MPWSVVRVRARERQKLLRLGPAQPPSIASHYFDSWTVGCMVFWLQLVGLQTDKCNQTGGSRTSRLHCFAAIAWKLDQGPLSVVLVLAREADAVEALT